MVTWTSGNHDGAPQLPPARFELVAKPGASWVCAGDFTSSWVDSLSAWSCREVVLTADVGDDVAGKHRVLELAEFLTFTLTESQPLIRVLFVAGTERATRRRTHA